MELNKANRKMRRGMDFKQMAAEAWSDWEWRNYVVGHPLAVPGLKKACLNNKYSVQFFEQYTGWGTIEHLIIRRHDSKPVRSWADMQRIKNELVGSDRTAVELFPAEKDLADEGNLYHLWVLPLSVKLPFGYRCKP